MINIKKAVLVSIEGQDGSGKDTLVNALAEHYRAMGWVVMIHTPYYNFDISRYVKDQIVSDGLNPKQQMASVIMTRALDMVRVASELSTNELVKSDYSNVIIFANRYTDSTYAYQCYAKKHNMSDPINDLVNWSKELGIPVPHQTLYINCPTATLKGRLASGYKELDEHESADNEFFDSIGNGLVESFREVYAGERTISVIDGTRDPSTVFGNALYEIATNLSQ